MEVSSCFNVTFDSNNCKELFPDNKISNFRVRLPRSIHLNDTWRVGLADVTFSNSRYTFDRPQLIEVLAGGTDATFEVWIEPALYHSVSDLVDVINEQIELTVITEKIPRVVYEDGRIKVENGSYLSLEGEKPLTIRFSHTLNNILGILRWGIPYLNARQPIVFVYCSIVKQRVVGDIAAKLLRTVDPSKGRKFGSVVSQVFRRIYFCSLDTHDFNEIEIQLLDDTGSEPLFKYGAFRVTLQFKQFV